MILDEKCKIMIGPFWGQFGPKWAILGTFATFLFLGTSKFEIYMKKQSRIRCVGDLSADWTITAVLNYANRL